MFYFNQKFVILKQKYKAHYFTTLNRTFKSIFRPKLYERDVRCDGCAEQDDLLQTRRLKTCLLHYLTSKSSSSLSVRLLSASMLSNPPPSFSPPPGIDLIAAFYGCLYAGCVPITVRPPHPQNIATTLPTVKMIVEVKQNNTVKPHHHHISGCHGEHAVASHSIA